MAHLGEFEVHPFADAFPFVDGEEFTQLVADVKKNGLREPIVLDHTGMVLIET
jgi:ParB-like chromosome segregation protein Spo0J